MTVFNGRIMYDPEDIIVGEIYTLNRKKYLVKSVSLDTCKYPLWGDKKGQFGITKRWQAHCIRLNDNKKAVVIPSTFDVKVNPTKFNRPFELTRDDIEFIEEGYYDDRSQMVYFGEEEKGYGIEVSYQNGKAVFSLINFDKDDIEDKKRFNFIEFNKKITLMASNGEEYSLIIVEK